jgi:hypothetical protein
MVQICQATRREQRCDAGKIETEESSFILCISMIRFFFWLDVRCMCDSSILFAFKTVNFSIEQHHRILPRRIYYCMAQTLPLEQTLQQLFLFLVCSTNCTAQTLCGSRPKVFLSGNGTTVSFQIQKMYPMLPPGRNGQMG